MVTHTHTPIVSNTMAFIRIFCGFLLCFVFNGLALADDFLEVDEAFKLRVEMRDKNQLAVVWDIAKDYKLYKSSLQAKPADDSLKLPELKLPKAKSGFDKGLGQVVETYVLGVTGLMTLAPATAGFELEISYQGCAVAGLCYPPQTRKFKVNPQLLGLQARVDTEDAATDTAANGAAPTTTLTSIVLAEEDVQEDSIQSVLKGGNLWAIGGAFLVFGLLLSLTPCVLPMLPILSSIIVGQQEVHPRRSFLLALSYSMGMALVYTSLGLAAGLVGEGLAAFMQKPWVLSMFALLLVIMALSMFDVFSLQLPTRFQGWMSQGVDRFQGGQYLSVFVMGALSSLIVGPCVAGPLAGALLYISQTRDVFIGGFALFVMACGMSVPLLLTGLSAGRLLPRAGNWMMHVKSVFGFTLFGVALWMVNPLLNDQARLMAWGALLVFSAFFTPLFSGGQANGGFFTKLSRAAGLLLLLLGMAEFMGGLMGGTDMSAPLKPHVTTATTSTSKDHVQFERIASIRQLEDILRNADRPVLLDLYADWCTSCLEMEKFTFTDATVVERMQSWRRLQIDVTKNSAEDRELMRRFNLFGPPAMIFFEANGREIQKYRLMGFLAATEFKAHLDNAIQLNQKKI